MTIEDRLDELMKMSESEHSRIYKEVGCELHCSCVFSQEEIERLVDLTKEPSYRLPSGLSREERRKWISDVGSKLLTQNSEEGMLVDE